MSPAEVKACSVWEFEQALAGWMEAHVPDEAGKMSQAEQDEVWAWMMEKEGR